ncbi:hypothetical protein [Streptomyces phytophilus]|uniref:hypothetical protein n=1 Tax=Streptomyces phytophilus TaxID=722715 RepID=UPI0015F0FA7D|nr:hypothetical protein [Streptomyces phytophilus]
MQHALNMRKELRELAPTEDGWRQFEPTGRVHLRCACGLDTGLVPHAQAAALMPAHRS